MNLCLPFYFNHRLQRYGTDDQYPSNVLLFSIYVCHFIPSSFATLWHGWSISIECSTFFNLCLPFYSIIVCNVMARMINIHRMFYFFQFMFAILFHHRLQRYGTDDQYPSNVLLFSIYVCHFIPSSFATLWHGWSISIKCSTFFNLCLPFYSIIVCNVMARMINIHRMFYFFQFMFAILFHHRLQRYGTDHQSPSNVLLFSITVHNHAFKQTETTNFIIIRFCSFSGKSVKSAYIRFVFVRV